ncbi:MAG: lysylphosphatidylglycerol synthase transmembrane domain-containing protein [Alphaproteobacteria bacterium]|nr:lysylphosphatidylglycerol synthase transmembrane domain-containing protein [Alphaproteobacteria bacterium]
MPPRFVLAVKVILACGLLLWLVKSDLLSMQALEIFYERPGVVAAIMGFMLLNVLLVTWRWRLLLSMFHLQGAPGLLFHINLIGLFGNIFLPGGAGGDALRAYYLSRHIPKSLTKILLSLILDRLVGLLALVFLAVVALFWLMMHGQMPARLALFSQMVVWLFIAGMMAFVAGMIMILPLQRVVRRFYRRRRTAFWRRLLQLFGVLRMVRASYWRILLCMAVSLPVHGLTLLGFAMLAHSMDIGNLSAAAYAVSVCFAMLANAVPITPGGIGVGEGAFAYFGHALSSENAEYATVFLAYRCIIVLFSLSGLWSFLRWRRS